MAIFISGPVKEAGCDVNRFCIEYQTPYYLRYLLLSTGVFFALGAVLARISREGLNAVRLASLAVSILGGCVSIYMMAINTLTTFGLDHNPYIPVLAWCIAVVLIISSFKVATVPGRILHKVRWAVREVGASTYALYLFHYITGAFLFGLLLKSNLSIEIALPVMVAFFLILNVCINLFVEALVRRFRPNRTETTECSLTHYPPRITIKR